MTALLHGAWRVTHENKYAEASRHLAEIARQELFEPDIALPFATNRRETYPYCASMGYRDSLMLMFLDPALILQHREDALTLPCSIR